MSSIGLIFSLFTFIFLTSCQVKEASSGGGLISDHAPATNKFVVQSPVSKTYVEAEVIQFNVTYPFDIIADYTGGNPQLRITVGSTTRYATFDSHPEPRKLVFTYTVQAGESDTNGIDVNALELNGSILQFDDQGVMTNCDVATVTTKNFSGAKVDTIAPTITNFALTNIPGLYNAGEKINFTMTFSEKVTVTGTPKFVMNLATGGAVDVDYVTGSGSTILAFSYTVGATHADTNGYNSITSPLDVGTGSIQDAVGNDANLDFSALTAAVITYSSNVKINGQYPYVINMTVPLNGTYLANDDLDFILEFDRDVTVSGFPYLEVVIGSNTRQAQYLTGSGTEQITFRYTAVPGDVDADGIGVTGSIVQNSGDIVDTLAPAISYFADVLNNSFSVPTTTGIILNSLQPQAISVARNTDSSAAIWGTSVDNVWIIGQELNLTIGFNTGIFVNQTSGTPTVQMTIGATPREATYLSGGNGQTSLVFRYVIQEGDLDTDGTIALGNIVLNGGVITDAENTNSLLTLPVTGLSTTRIDGVKPVISTVSKPADGTYSQVAPLNAGAMDFVVNWSEAVNYSSTASNAAYLSMDVGGTAVRAQYATGNNSAAVTHSPTTLASRNDTDGVTLSSPLAGTAIIKDQAGNTATTFTYTPPVTSGILVDTTAPTVSDMDPITSNGTYKAGETLDFTVTFNESVTTNVSGGYPRIPVVIGSTTRYLLPTTNTTNTTHTFRYTIQANDLDTNGISVTGTIAHNGSGYARDGGRNNVASPFTAPSTPGIMVDAVVPTVSGSSASTARTYVSGETLQISVTFSENITVDETDGTPYIAVDFDQGTDNYTYASGSGTSTLVFSRTLGATHFDMNGLPGSITSITLNNGTLQDVGGNDAPTTFPAVNLSTTYVTYPEVKLWVRSNFVNMAPPGGATVTNNGIVSTEACGSGTCRSFSGDDSLYLSSALNGIETVLIAFKMPPDLGTDQEMFGPDILIDAKFTNYDIITTNATIIFNGTTLNLNDTTHNTNSAYSSTNIMQVDYQWSQSYSAETLIPLTFDGAIGEVIAIEGTLTSTQKDNIRNYLDSRF